MERRINEKIKELEGDPEALYEYLGKCVPHIKEYMTERTGGVKRKDIYNEYMSSVENETIDMPKKSPIDVPFYSPKCNAFLKVIYEKETSDQICTECGNIEYVQSTELGYKEEQEMDVKIVYSYKRENHFNEWIAQFQAKESTTVPLEVIDQLRIEFKKQRIKDSSEITHR